MLPLLLESLGDRDDDEKASASSDSEADLLDFSDDQDDNEISYSPLQSLLVSEQVQSRIIGVPDLPFVDSPQVSDVSSVTSPESVEAVVETTIRDIVVNIIESELYESLMLSVDLNNNLVKPVELTDIDLSEIMVSLKFNFVFFCFLNIFAAFSCCCLFLF